MKKSFIYVIGTIILLSSCVSPMDDDPQIEETGDSFAVIGGTKIYLENGYLLIDKGYGKQGVVSQGDPQNVAFFNDDSEVYMLITGNGILEMRRITLTSDGYDRDHYLVPVSKYKLTTQTPGFVWDNGRVITDDQEFIVNGNGVFEVVNGIIPDVSWDGNYRIRIPAAEEITSVQYQDIDGKFKQTYNLPFEYPIHGNSKYQIQMQREADKYHYLVVNIWGRSRPGYSWQILKIYHFTSGQTSAIFMDDPINTMVVN
jgi:hypothetical protein